jgi:uncharacterized protein YyaL (SSP411 family)
VIWPLLWSCAPSGGTNRLGLEQSPYLREHASDPVDWWPWGEAAFTAAREQDKLVFLSIGYATCHWCHVMQQESFQDLEIAGALDAGFVSIKVDREEHPDLDEIYQAALRQMTGGGGWPTNVVLTPDGEIVLAMGYLPARDGDRGVSRGLLTVLGELQEGWRGDRERLVREAADNTRALVERARPRPPGQVPGAQVEQEALARFGAAFDPRHGGFGRAPKFPRAPSLDLLLGVASRQGPGHEQALSMVTATLRALGDGGIHDVLGGGFHRYTVDEAWAVPHYEKTTSGNAQLARTYVVAWQLTGEPRLLALGLETLQSLPGGGLGTALDADSAESPSGPRIEGAYYTWTRAQPEPLATRLSERFGVTDEPGALHVAASWEELAQRHPVSAEELQREVAEGLSRLAEVRARRPAPRLDDKQLASNTGLVLSALARAAWATGDPALRARALQVERSLQALRPQGRLRHASTSEEPALLEDHARVAEGYLDLLELDGDPRWLRAAVQEMDEIERRMADPAGGWFRTPEDRQTPLYRPRSDTDGDEASGLAVASSVCLRLASLTGEPRWQARVDGALAASAERLTTSPTSAAALVEVLARRHSPPPELVMAWPAGAAPGPLLESVRRASLPGRIVVQGTDEALQRLAPEVPLVQDKRSDGAPTVWVCRSGVCQAPSTTQAELEAALAAALAR